MFTVASVGKRWVATNDGRRRHRPSMASSSDPRRDFSDKLSSSKELSSDSSPPGLGSVSRENNGTGTHITLRYKRIAPRSSRPPFSRKENYVAVAWECSTYFPWNVIDVLRADVAIFDTPPVDIVMIMRRGVFPDVRILFPCEAQPKGKTQH